MPQAFRYPSSTNVHPVATDFVIGFVRKKDEFPLNRYIQLVQAPAATFFYHELDPDQSIRIRNLGLHAWADGAKRPDRQDNQFGFRELQAFVVRYNFGSTIGNQAIQAHNNQWKAKTVYLEGLASQAMVAKTLNLWKGTDGTAAGSTGWTGLDNSASWPSTNVADVNTLNDNAGTWDKASADPSDASYMAIRKSLFAAANKVFLLTNGRVKWKDLRLVIGQECARKMSNTSEIREFYKYGPFAKEAIEGPDNYNQDYGLGKHLYGIELVVEDSMIIQTPPGASQTGYSTDRTRIKADQHATLLSRPGKLDGQFGPSFSTVQNWWFESQLKVQEFVDPIDELTEFNIVDQYTFTLSAGRAGFMIQNVL